MREMRRGEILRIKDVSGGRVRVVTASGTERNIQVLGKGEEVGFPEGTIESMLPLMERITSRFPGIVSPDNHDFWLSLQEKAPQTPRQAAITLRRSGFSSKVVGQEIVRRMIRLSGATPEREDQGLVQQLKDEAAEAVRKIYVETTEVRPRLPRKK
ncbi:hypothetical protein A3E46_00570 [Candidatus Woesebacteria bacterium RIFCSPHIGHO2_12_FULL_46_16]|uniref:Uncharacterized protein n=1 Tax=Candidatus Woesebacteria bacterium RIFCSPHIGHO2_12_FULL_46_16 TaxID=1802513 RepID=A0A1F8B1W9_9BACT|nr:MAG: hypothetical protein A3E46_00570 [Candidatus Woesebacteria bacterium RIFCSPHIGHO2_12_FULL_46_16]